MTLLENYLDNYNNKELSKLIYSMYQKFDYDDEDIFHMDLDFMLNNIYDIKMIEQRQKRIGQQEFKKNISELYNNKCIVTGNNCPEELEAAHIIPVSEEEDYSLDNGLLLERNIHVTFDKYFWSINPETFIIETLNKGTIAKYHGKKLDLPNSLKENLREHYNKFRKIN